MDVFIIAHGALGAADEIIFLGIAVIFIGMMGVTWVRSQSIELEAEEPEQPAKPKASRKKPSDTAPDRFKLD